jgi:hypothetical protein
MGLGIYIKTQVRRPVYKYMQRKLCTYILNVLGYCIYLGTSETNQNHIHEKVKTIFLITSMRKLRAYSYLLPRNLNIKIYKTIILPPTRYMGEKLLSFTLWEGQRFIVFKNRVLRRIF